MECKRKDKSKTENGENMKYVREQKKECCGCTACTTVCPQNVISMKADEEGFLYPVINEGNCIECKLCIQVCDFNKSQELEKRDRQDVYALRLKEKNKLKESQSGGAFAAIAQVILRENGYVVGAVMDDEFKVHHVLIESENDLKKLKGTKYVQSDLDDTYEKVRAFIENGQSVLFSGTPCQVAGLNSYIQKKMGKLPEKLYTCDIICHGVPSPLIWEKEVEYMKQMPSALIEIRFRDKEKGWHNNISTFIYENGEKVSNNVYNTMYANGLITRPACEQCRYTSIDRCSDMTIGDYWGIEKVAPQMDDNAGVSVVMVNSEKGNEVFKKLQDECECIRGDINSCNQPQLHEPMVSHLRRSEFWSDYMEKGYSFVREKYVTKKRNGLGKRALIRILDKMGVLDKLIVMIKKIKGSR